MYRFIFRKRFLSVHLRSSNSNHSQSLACLVFLYSVVLASPSLAANTWFPGPFSTDGRWIANAKGDRLTYAGVNWPGAAETMVPEGLQYASIPDAIKKIKSIGMNA